MEIMTLILVFGLPLALGHLWLYSTLVSVFLKLFKKAVEKNHCDENPVYFKTTRFIGYVIISPLAITLASLVLFSFLLLAII